MSAAYSSAPTRISRSRAQGVIDDVLRRTLGLANELMLGDELGLALARLLEDALGLALGLGHHLLALLDDPAPA